MSSTRRSVRQALACTALALALGAVGGCMTARLPSPEAAAALPADGGAFSVAENALDTWNTIGKVLVAMDDVGYEGRAQMLGLYSVRFRDQHFLLRAQAVVLRDAASGVHTRVDALDQAGKPLVSAASVELLGRLAARVPVEVARYRQPVKPPIQRTRPAKHHKPG